VIPDAESAAREWRARKGAIQINHMIAVKPEVDEAALMPLLHESFAAAGNPELNPIGREANRRNLETAIDFVHRQGLIPRRYAVEELLA
jgi:4,5-dihydroxyphthalate decarboxylase